MGQFRLPKWAKSDYRTQKYTAEEFETAFGQFKATNKPFIFTYFKDAPISTGSADEDDLMSLFAFKKKLKALGHFQTVYQNIDALKLHFNQQLDKLVASGFIEPKSDQGRAAGSTDSTRPAKQQTEQQVKAYLRWLRSRTESIELRGIERAGGAPVVLLPLETAYVPLRAKSMPRLGEAQEVMHFKQGRRKDSFVNE